MELEDALARISEIRVQMARTCVFRGYRSVPIALSGGLAFLAGAIQKAVVADPAAHPIPWLELWVGTAVLSVALCAFEMVVRHTRSPSVLERERIRLAVGQFLPAIVAGGLLTVVIMLFADLRSVTLLPGLWSVLMGLGVFASLSLLPRAVLAVGLWYVGAGLAVIVLARGPHALSPLAMSVPFGVGQILGAAVLYFTLERNGGQQEEE